MSSPVSPLIRGTSLSVRFSRAVDGDTIRVFLPGSPRDESLRVLCVDTEESFSTSSTKPVTPWGKAAKRFCADFFRAADTVTLEFPSSLPLATALRTHRGSFGRLLVHVWRETDGVDLSEALIAAGFSPYYTKYGHAHFAGHRARYERAERLAQRGARGIWDPTASVNGGTHFNNYALLKAWWNIRADAIEEFRNVRRVVGDKSVLDVEHDYDTIVKLANGVDDGDAGNSGHDGGAGNVVTVFTDVPDIRVGDTYASLSIGARYKPLSVYIPRVSRTASLGDADDAEGSEEEEISKGQQVVNVLLNRYVDDGPMHPRRGYVFLSGLLRTFRGRPQLVVDDPAFVRDSPGPRPLPPLTRSSLPVSARRLLRPGGETEADEDEDDVPPPVRAAAVSVRIAALLPDPAGGDSGNEVVTLGVAMTAGDGDGDGDGNGMTNDEKEEEDGDGEKEDKVTLKGWKLRDLQGRTSSLSGVVVSRREARTAEDGETLVDVKVRGLTLNNGGDTVFVLDELGRVVDRVQYSATDVETGRRIEFPRE